jgi:microcystin-dependent protein
MSQPFLGEIRIVPFSVLPSGWAYCDGSLLPVSQYTALFALLGFTYGGNGSTAFALPDLRGRVAIASGQGFGLSNYEVGQQGGVETYSLQVSEMAPHSHLVDCNSGPATMVDPTYNFASPVAKERNLYTSPADGLANPLMVSNAGEGFGHENMQPYVTLAYMIATRGIFPPRPQGEKE